MGKLAVFFIAVLFGAVCSKVSVGLLKLLDHLLCLVDDGSRENLCVNLSHLQVLVAKHAHQLLHREAVGEGESCETVTADVERQAFVAI